LRTASSVAKHLLPLVTGAVTGGYLARVGLEVSGRPWPWPAIVSLGLLFMAGGALLAVWPARVISGRWAGRGWPAYWPMLLLGLYLVWPQRQLSVAWRVLILVGASLLIVNVRGRRQRPIPMTAGALPARRRWLCWEKAADLATFAIALSFYVLTTAPGLLPADSGEFQIVAALGGVAHPPGYALYSMLGWLFVRLVPVGSAAFRLNLMSALLAAATLTLVGAATRRWSAHLFGGREGDERTGRGRGAAIGAGLAAALTLGTSATFWSQATIANIRMPTALAAAAGFYALACYADARDRRQADRSLAVFALAMGIGVVHHPSLLFLGVFFLLYLLLIDPRLLAQPRRWWRPVLLALVGLLPLVYIPLRGAAGAPLAPPDVDTWSGFLHHVTARGFEGDMFAFATRQDLTQRLLLVPTLFGMQFSPALLAAAALGAAVLARHSRRLLVLLAGGLILHTFVAITYRAPQTVEYLMPAYLPIAILVGIAVAWLLSLARAPAEGSAAALLNPVATVLAAAALLAGLVNGLNHAPSFFVLARDRSTRTDMEAFLGGAPADALVLADWRWATPLWYLNWAEGQRPDVEISYVYPIPGQEIWDTWQDRIQGVAGTRPLLLTSYYDLSKYTLEPLGQGFRLYQRPLETMPQGYVASDAVFKGTEGRIRLLGYRLDRSRVRPWQTMELTLAWQVVDELAASPSFSAKLWAPDGRLLSQNDLGLVGDFLPGEIRFERLLLPIYPHVAAGAYALELEVYNSGASGFETWVLGQGQGKLSLGNVEVEAALASPVTLHPLDIPFDDGPRLVGVDYERLVGGPLRVYLHWQGPVQAGTQIDVAGNVATLPALSAGAFHSTLLDLPGDVAGALPLRLTIAGDEVPDSAGPWGWARKQVGLPPAAPGARYVPFGDEIALIGVKPVRGQPISSGGTLMVQLAFLTLKPLVSDDAISVSLWAPEGGLLDRHSMQPALGAIPTLKWIRGTRVLDPHPLRVAPELQGEVVRASLVVYERFRGPATPLRPLDGRVGEVQVWLGEWPVSEP
jgi:hypothetical protein